MSEGEKKKTFKFTPKIGFYAGGLGGLLIFIVISAVWDLTFGRFDLQTFIAESLILTAIALASMLLCDLFSQEMNKNKLYGVYNIAVNNYMNAMKRLEPIRIYFSQWFFWFLVRETKNKREGYLMLHGIEGTDAKKIVRFAEMSDIQPMVEATKKYVKVLEDGTKIVLPKLETIEQQKAVESVLKGEQDIKDVNYSKYLFVDDVAEMNMSTLERQEHLAKRRSRAKKRAYIRRIFWLILTCLLMAALVPADEEEARNKMWLFAKRLGVFFTSCISGWLAGSTDVVAQASMINDKTDKLNTCCACYEQGEWAPKTEEEMDKEFIEEYEKQPQLEEAVEGESYGKENLAKQH